MANPVDTAPVHRLPRIAMASSLAVAVLMLAGKLTASWITGSAAILSDAAESVVHILATCVAAFSLWYAARDPNKKFPYGHGKIAYFSAGLEGAFILSAAFFIIHTAIRELVIGPELKELGIGIAITGALAAVNLALGLFLVIVGRRHNSLIVEANGRHVLTDMWTSVGVVAGVAVVYVTGVVWLDPVVAILVALNITRESYSLIRRSLWGLLDEADPKATMQIADCLRAAQRAGLISDYHQLRHRQSNDVMWVEVHMLLPGPKTIQDGHANVTRIEDDIRALFPTYSVFITTHIEPDAHDEAHPGGHGERADPIGHPSVTSD